MSDGNAARPMLMSYEPGTRRLFVNDMHGALYSVSTRRKDGDAVSGPSAIRAGTSRCSSRISSAGSRASRFIPQFNQRGARGYGKIYTYTDTTQRDADADWTPCAGHEGVASCGAPRVDGEESGSRDLRRRRPARADAVAASVRQSQRRTARLQPDRAARQRRLRSALSGQCRWRQRRRSDEHRAESRLARSARFSASIRSATTARTASTAFRRTTRSSTTTIRTRSARSTRTARAIRSASRGTRRPARCTWPTSARASSKR